MSRLSQTIPALPATDVAASVDDTDFGTLEFATIDRDGNLVTFFQWVSE